MTDGDVENTYNKGKKKRNKINDIFTVVNENKIMAARASSPSSIYHIPGATFTQRPSIDVKVKSLSYTVNPASLSWWQKLSTMQLPWEWVDNSEPQQVLNNVSFGISSGQMLAIMGNSGWYIHFVLFDHVWPL